MADHASVSVVVSNDDLLTEILLRLPAVSLHLFKSVSKRWLSLINDARFTLTRSQIRTIDPPSGLFILENGFRFNYKFVSFESRIPSKRLFTFTLGAEAPINVVILRSCNGLLLCSSGFPLYELYVYNPSRNNQCKIIPQSPTEHVDPSLEIIMAFDPSKSPYYKLIHAISKYDVEDGLEKTWIQIYFSKTGVWSVCGDWFPTLSFREFSHAVFHNDAIHWLNNWTAQPLHYMLDIMNENPSLANIQLPTDKKLPCKQKLFQSCSSLLLLANDYVKHTRKLIYEMRNRYSEWSLKYIVNTDGISNYFRLFDVCCIVLGERKEDSFMVITLPRKIVRYRIMLKTLHTLCEHTTYGDSRDIQFIASYAAI